MKDLFAQGGKGSTGVLTNKQAIARHFGVKQEDIIYFEVGKDLSGYKVIFDKSNQRAYILPTGLPLNTIAISLDNNAVLVHSNGTIDLGELAVQREEYVTLSGSFTSGATILTKNELLTFTNGKYRWDGSLPKLVLENSTPESSGGIGDTKWIPVGDTELRSTLTSPGGALYVSNSSILVDTVDYLKNAVWSKVGVTYEVLGYKSVASGGKGNWFSVLTSSVTPNDIDIVQSIVNPTISFVFQPINGVVDIRQLGAVGGTDVTSIINRAYAMPNINTVYLSALTVGEVFNCSAKIIAGKTTYGINKPVFDFATSPVGSDSWSYDLPTSPQTNNIVYQGFEVRNSKFRGFSGGGDNVIFRELIVRDASEQAIGWQGNRWKVINCQIFGTKVSYDIVIGGTSNDVEVTGCHIEGAVTLGGIEPAYSSRNVNIHNNFIRNQPYGVLVWVRTPDGVAKLSTNVSITGNIFSELSKGGVWIRNDEADFNARSVIVADNIFHSNNADAAFAIRVGGWSDVLIQNNLITDYNAVGCLGIQLDDFNGHPTGAVTIKGNTFDTIQQCINFTTNIDGVVIRNNIARNVTYDFVVYPVGNSMANCKVSDNEASVGRDYLRNFSYMSARHIRNNSFKLPLTGTAQLNGASVQAGDKFLLYPPVPGSAEGFVCTTSGVAGTSAVFKNLAVIAS